MKREYLHACVRAAVLLIGFLSTAGGCNLFPGTRTILLHTPEFPSSWQGFAADLRLDIVVNGNHEGSVGAGSALRLAVPADRPSVVLAFPRLTAPEVTLLPAGAVVRGNEETVWASWEDGPLATILRQVDEAGYPLHRVNTARMREEIATRAGRYAWGIRIPRVVEAVVSESLRVYDLTPQAAVEITIDLEAAPGRPSTWLSADPLNPDPVDASQDGQLALSLSRGTHQLLSSDGAQVIVVQIHDDGSAVSVSR